MAIDEQKVEEAAGGAVQHRAGGPAMSDLMYLGAAHFDGDPGELLPAYYRLLERFGVETLDVHLCVIRDGGLTVFDACPSQEVYASFTASDMFREAVAAAGLPVPRVEGLGGIRVAHLRREVRP